MSGPAASSIYGYASFVVGLILFVMFLSTRESGCVSSGGVHWTYDEVRHSFSWGDGK